MKKDQQLLGSRYKYNSGIPFFIKRRMSRRALLCLEELNTKIKSSDIKQNEHKACPLCFNAEAILIAQIDRLGIPCNTVICKGCGFLFNDSFFSEDSLNIIYKEYYGKINFDDKSPEETFRHRTSPDAFSWKRFAFIALHFGDDLKKVNTVFEIGCRDGCNLLPFYLAGKEVMGCDFDEEYLDVGRKRGMNLLQGDVKILRARGLKADIIILSHVLEHFIDLDREITSISNILNPGGYLYVEVPGIFNWNRKRKDFLVKYGYRSTNDFLSYIQSVHNYHFDLEKVSSLFEKKGFEMIVGDGWVRAIFRKVGIANLERKSYSDSNVAEKVMTYLKTVESDFKSVSSQIYRLMRKLL